MEFDSEFVQVDVFLYLRFMIHRIAYKRLQTLAQTFRAVALIGPRQSGKTTICKTLFANKPYVSLENPDVYVRATQDPRQFLGQYKNGAVLDEIQRVPELFSYLQQILDETDQKGLFILTGSNNFLLEDKISQSLAGRIAYQQLLPLSLQEAATLKPNYEAQLFQGFYPEVVAQNINPLDWYPNYINTYLERDVRLIKNISHYMTFLKFVRLCAGRVGGVLNMSNLASDCGIDQKTAQSWLGMLQKSFIVYLLKPYYNNYSKRLIKSPKLYFYDTGLASALLGIERADQLTNHPLKGMLFENMVVIDFLKQRMNAGLPDNLYFWRDKTGREVDLLLDGALHIDAYEIKAGETIAQDFFKHLSYYSSVEQKKVQTHVIYGGQGQQGEFQGTQIHSWMEL